MTADERSGIAGRRLGSIETLGYGADLWSRLEPAWSLALQADPTASVFQSCEWIRAWISAYGARVQPAGLIWRDAEGAVVGAALLSITRKRLGPIPVRQAWINATGEDEVMSEHNTLLGVPEWRAHMVEQLAAEARRRGADQLMLAGFPSVLAHDLRAAWPSGERGGHESEDRFVDLAALRAEGRDFLSSLSRNTREQVRRATRLYTESFGAPVLETAPDPATALAWQSELVALHEARWHSRGGSGSFASDGARSFHHALQASCASAGRSTGELRVDLVRVRFGEETIALLYNLVFRGIVSFYQSGLRYHADNKLKPGLVAHAIAVQHYLGRDEVEYDFLAGEATAVQYKRSLAHSSRTLVWEELSVPSAKMRVVREVRAWRRRWRELRAPKMEREPDAVTPAVERAPET